VPQLSTDLTGSQGNRADVDQTRTRSEAWPLIVALSV
jgi:hypothetical protein